MSKQTMAEYVNQETIFGLVPVKKSERQYGFWDTLLVTSGFAIGVIVFALCFTIVPLSDIVSYKPDLASLDVDAPQAYALAAEGMVAFSFSWSTQAIVLPRLCRTERAGYWGTFSGYAVVAPFFVFIGGIMAIVMFVSTGVYESDPTVMLATLGPSVALLSLMLVAFANIGTQAVGSYVNDLVLKAAWPKVSYRTLVWLSCIYVSILTLTGEVTANFGQFISIAAYIQGPIIGIMFVDYIILRHRRFSLKALYCQKGHDAYQFSGGVNWVGVACILVTLAVALVFVYNPITGVIKSPLFCVFTGSGFTALLGGVLYYALTKIPRIRAIVLRDRDDLEIA